jgi:hypothetical protein
MRPPAAAMNTNNGTATITHQKRRKKPRFFFGVRERLGACFEPLRAGLRGSVADGKTPSF